MPVVAIANDNGEFTFGDSASHVQTQGFMFFELLSLGFAIFGFALVGKGLLDMFVFNSPNKPHTYSPTTMILIGAGMCSLAGLIFMTINSFGADPASTTNQINRSLDVF